MASVGSGAEGATQLPATEPKQWVPLHQGPRSHCVPLQIPFSALGSPGGPWLLATKGCSRVVPRPISHWQPARPGNFLLGSRWNSDHTATW